nr:hypothetical protein [Bacteroidota bacterium]
MKTIKSSGLLFLMIVICNCVYSQEHFDSLQNKVVDSLQNKLHDSTATLNGDTSKIKSDSVVAIIRPVIKTYKYIVDSLL